MNEVMTSNEENTEDSLISRHRKEKKELQAKIQSLKKTASKGDKKKRKEVLEEISKLEINLEERHAKELNDLNSAKCNKDVSEGQIQNKEKLIEDNNAEPQPPQQEQPRISKAQRRRDKKAKKIQEKEAEILAQEELNETGPRMIELKTIKKMLKNRGLELHSISSDGNCLYNAIKHQLELTGRKVYDIFYLRNETANYIIKNKEHLISYMTSNDTGDILSDKEFEEYCEDIRRTAAWGGQVEIKALSHILRVPIEVIQSTGPSTIQGDIEYEGPPLIITYHRHMYSLGEHYNSTKHLTNQDSAIDGDSDFENDAF